MEDRMTQALHSILIFAKGILVCATVLARHLDGPASHNRSWHRVLFCVEDIDGDDLRLYVPQWNPESTVHVSLSTLPSELRRAVEPGNWFMAKAQIESDTPLKIRLRDFETPPTPDPNDALS